MPPVTPAEVRTASRAFCQAVSDLGPWTRPGDLSSVRLVTPAGILSGPHALETFEAIQRGWDL
ncbi:hypothetical protein [Methanofollis aquaemaris]|nr:hypothetical protein [Methanofollis aquaemaris]